VSRVISPVRKANVEYLGTRDRNLKLPVGKVSREGADIRENLVKLVNPVNQDTHNSGT
jgi:ribosomal protein L1